MHTDGLLLGVLSHGPSLAGRRGGNLNFRIGMRRSTSYGWIFGSGRQAKDLGTGPETRKILADLLSDINELKTLLANEGMVIFGACGAQLIHPSSGHYGRLSCGCLIAKGSRCTACQKPAEAARAAAGRARRGKDWPAISRRLLASWRAGRCGMRGLWDHRRPDRRPPDPHCLRDGGGGAAMGPDCDGCRPSINAGYRPGPLGREPGGIAHAVAVTDAAKRRDRHLGWRLQVDPEVQPSIEAPGLPPEAALLCVLTRRLGTDAVEALALDVELPRHGGDLVVEEVEPAEGLGVGELEVPVASVAVVLDRYGHLLPGHEEAVLAALDALAKSPPTPDADLLALPLRETSAGFRGAFRASARKQKKRTPSDLRFYCGR